MCSYAIPGSGQAGTDALPGYGIPREPLELPRLTLLSRELRRANADYRSLALHAGPLHRLTLDARGRVDHIAAMLRAETERLRSSAVSTPV